MLNDVNWSKRELLILAFDHRGTFLKNMLGVRGREPTDDETKKIAEFKSIIYDGFRRALEKGVPRRIAGILVDEQFGAAVARAALAEGITLAMPCEKSGQEEFDFEYGGLFGKHIEAFRPTFAKVLVRYNPEADKDMNARQLERLKLLGDYLLKTRRAYLFGLLVPPTPAQMASVLGDNEAYDREVRPGLMLKAIEEIQSGGIEPDVWKLEGVEKEEDAKALVKQVQNGGRKAGVITLGRGESREKVKEWLEIGARVDGIIGFAVGRTIFWDALVWYNEKKIDRDTAVEKIAHNYLDFVQLWIKEKKAQDI